TIEFNSFSKGSIDGTDNTRQLVNQFSNDTKLIVTTIQKLNTAISKKNYLKKMEPLKDEKVVFIFDECHRSQFGDTHNRIKNFFNNHQMFGFTGTPIFKENAVKNDLGKRTTKSLFDKCLHKYVISDAIKDENVLKFAVEYVGKYKKKDSANEIDIEVEDIDRKELMESETRLDQIVDYIIANHDRKTHRREFTAILCVSSVEMLIKYYETFQQKKEDEKHDLKIATIFSFTPNEDDAEAKGYLPEEVSVVEESPALYGLKSHTREKLDEYIDHYNKMFGSNYSTKDSQSFYNYYNDVSKKAKKGQIDILLVVNMFLTGFDSKHLNTLYVDKNLKYHGLIQAYSRTNRILNEKKSQGNIISFRNLKKNTDEALKLFSDKNPIEEVIKEPYEDHVAKFNEAYIKLLSITPTVNSVNDLVSEEDELQFIQNFRELIRIKNAMSTYSDFNWEDLAMDEQKFEDYKSKYLDLHDKVKTNRQTEKVSILEEVDFELELIHKDEINVTYILKLLESLKETNVKDKEKKKKEIIDTIAGESGLRSKRELIEKFIEENLPKIEQTDTIPQEFEKFWKDEQIHALENLVNEENLDKDKTQTLIDTYLFAEREPLSDDALSLIQGEQPSVLKRKKVADRIIDKIVDFVDTFVNGME
ncbi:MAG: type I restriction endonuclease subunit R, EcoR124 family, partial [Bacteroidota bacterium]